MVEGDDIFGEAVNIAARLQELAPLGGILISAPVYHQVHNKLTVAFNRLEPQQVKNVATPVVSYRVRVGTPAPATHDASPAEGGGIVRLASAMAGPGPGGPDRILGLRRPIAVALAVCLFLVLINAFTRFRTIWFHWPVASILFVVLLRTMLGRRLS